MGDGRVYDATVVRRVPGGIASRELAPADPPAGIIPRMTAAEAPAPPAIHEQPRTVVAADLDALGHVNNLRYLEWMLAAAVDHSDAVGWPWARYEALGNAWVVRSHQIEYLRPAFVGDEVVVRTWVSEMGKVSSRRKYAIARGDGSLLARAETLWVFISRRTHALDRVPAELQAAFTLHVEPPAGGPAGGAGGPPR